MSTSLFYAGTNSLWDYAATRHLMHTNFPQRECMVYKLKAEWGRGWREGSRRPRSRFQLNISIGRVDVIYRVISRDLCALFRRISFGMIQWFRGRGTRFFFASSRTLAMDKESPVRPFDSLLSDRMTFLFRLEFHG